MSIPATASRSSTSHDAGRSAPSPGAGPATTTGPLAVVDDVVLIRSLPGDGPDRLAVNSLVITGAEPVLVDTGAAAGRDEWWRQVEAAVDPADVRWIFLSHDDHDHDGNLIEALARCPAATLLAGAALSRTLPSWAGLDHDRCRWIEDGAVFSAGDRDLLTLRPPAYDAPGTRGLFDVRSGVYWSADCFSVPVPHEVDEVSDLDRDVWEDGFLAEHRRLSPWAAEMDPQRWSAAIRRVAALEPTVLASAHGPLVRRRDIAAALDLLEELPGLPAPPPG